jgi:hypothetical protein
MIQEFRQDCLSRTTQSVYLPVYNKSRKVNAVIHKAHFRRNLIYPELFAYNVGRFQES